MPLQDLEHKRTLTEIKDQIKGEYEDILKRGLYDTTLDTLEETFKTVKTGIQKAPGAISDVYEEQGALGILNAVNPTAGLVEGPRIAKEGWKEFQQGEYLSGMGKMIGGAADAATLGKVAWHGTPHKFNKFTTQKIGTGEGAQAYGYGLYFAEDPKIANYYKRAVRADPGDVLADTSGKGLAADLMIRPTSGRIDKKYALDYIDKYLANKPGKTAHPGEIRAYNKYAKVFKAARKQINKGYTPETGNLYRVDIKDEAIDSMLDWDKPLSKQTDAVKQLAKDIYGSSVMGHNAHKLESITGKQLYWDYIDAIPMADKHGIQTLGHSAAKAKLASENMGGMGIRGIKYKDATSRVPGQKSTRNFVVFDEADVTTLSREGKRVTPNRMETAPPTAREQHPPVREIFTAPKYQKEWKGRQLKVEYMTPDEYIKKVEKGFSRKNDVPVSQEEIFASRNQADIQTYAKQMQKGDKFPMPYIDHRAGDFNQEGLHRAAAAKIAGYDEIPVAVIRDTKVRKKLDRKVHTAEQRKMRRKQRAQAKRDEISTDFHALMKRMEMDNPDIFASGDRIRRSGITKAAQEKFLAKQMGNPGSTLGSIEFLKKDAVKLAGREAKILATGNAGTFTGKVTKRGNRVRYEIKNSDGSTSWYLSTGIRIGK